MDVVRVESIELLLFLVKRGHWFIICELKEVHPFGLLLDLGFHVLGEDGASVGVGGGAVVAFVGFCQQGMDFIVDDKDLVLGVVLVELLGKRVVVGVVEHVVEFGLELVALRDKWEELVVVLQNDLIIENGILDWLKRTERTKVGTLSLDQRRCGGLGSRFGLMTELVLLSGGLVQEFLVAKAALKSYSVLLRGG